MNTPAAIVDATILEQPAIKILHIEDEAADAAMVAFELENVGLDNVRITVVDRMADALLEVKRQCYDVALLDLNLPDSTGMQTYQQLREEAPDLPVVVLTGSSEQGMGLRMLEQGVQDYLPKKYMKGDLLANAVRFAIERHRLMSELEEHARQLSLNESRLRRIIEADIEAIVIVDGSRNIVFSNPAALSLFGCDAGELFQKPFTLSFSPGEIYQQEIARADGSSRIVDIHAVDITWEDSNAILVSLRDITEHKQLEQQLVQSQKMEAIGQLTGGLAHDFNNLLGVVLGNLEVIESLAQGNDKLLQHIQIAQKAARSGASLTKRLLAFACKQTLTPTCVSVNELIAGMQELFARTLGARIELSVNLSPDIPLVIVDRGELENVLLNLAINSGDAIKDAGNICFATEAVCFDSNTHLPRAGKVEPGCYVRIRVTDDGEGMSQDVLGKLFEPFFTTKRPGDGTGLGLSMIYGFVKQSNGYIDIASEPDNGTTVDIYIPQATEDERAQFESAELQASPQTESAKKNTQDSGVAKQGGETILLVDDTEELLMLAEMILEQNGYSVLTAGNAQQALEYIDSDCHIDMVLTDIIMPGEMNGVELCEHIKQRQPRIKVAFTSGYSADALKAKAGVSLAGRLINKPYQSQELLDSIRNVLDGRTLN